MRVALRAVTDDRDLLAFEHGEVTVVVIPDLCSHVWHSFTCVPALLPAHGVVCGCALCRSLHSARLGSGMGPVDPSVKDFVLRTEDYPTGNAATAPSPSTT